MAGARGGTNNRAQGQSGKTYSDRTSRSNHTAWLVALMRQVTFLTHHYFYSFLSHPQAEPSRKIRETVAKQQQRYNVTYDSMI
jgi:hypothetical protein